MILYLAGPMRGYPAFNFKAFKDAAHELRRQRISIFSPAEADFERDPEVADQFFSLEQYGEWMEDNPEGWDLRTSLAADAEFILTKAEGVIFLPGYEKSSGAKAERALAEALGLPLFYYAEGVPIPLEDWENRESGVYTSPDGEVRITSATGGVKGQKAAQFQSMPPAALLELARQYGAGANKYGDHNFRKGYPWSLSYSALCRHLLQFWGGEDHDEETGEKHIIAVAWHALALATFMDEHPEFDDRYKG